jgi:hypothetical protein
MPASGTGTIGLPAGGQRDYAPTINWQLDCLASLRIEAHERPDRDRIWPLVAQPVPRAFIPLHGKVAKPGDAVNSLTDLFGRSS